MTRDTVTKGKELLFIKQQQSALIQRVELAIMLLQQNQTMQALNNLKIALGELATSTDRFTKENQ